MYCQKCGSKIPDDSKWCPQCGSKPKNIEMASTLKIAICFFCLLSAILFIVAGISCVNYALNATYNFNNPLDFIIVSIVWMAFGFAAVLIMLFILLYIKFFRN